MLPVATADGRASQKAQPCATTQFQVPLPPVDEKKKVTEDVEKDRRYAIDAAIVRTMKSRKTLNHQSVSGTHLSPHAIEPATQSLPLH